MKSKEEIKQRMKKLNDEGKFYLGAVPNFFLEYYEQDLEAKIGNDPTLQEFRRLLDSNPQNSVIQEAVELCDWVLKE